MAQLKYYTKTRKARDWSHIDNEDYMLHTRFSIMNDNMIDVLVLADGMGGLSGGSIASKAAATRFVASFYQQILAIYEPEEKDFTAYHYCDRVKDIMEHAFADANEAVCAVMEQAGRCGTTLSACVIIGDYLLVGNVGDSPVYYYDSREDETRILSELQTLAEEEVRLGRYERFSEQYYEKDHILNHYLGEFSKLPGDVIAYNKVEKLNREDFIMLASDGAVGQRKEAEITKILTGTSPYQALKALFEAAREDKDDDQTAVWAIVS